MRALTRLSSLLLLSAAISGCEATHFFITHNTVVGVDAAVSSDFARGHLMVGYDRSTLAIVPKTVEGSGQSNEKELMTTLSCSHLEVHGLFLTQFTQYVVAGEAAKNYAENVKGPGKGAFHCPSRADENR